MKRHLRCLNSTSPETHASASAHNSAHMHVRNGCICVASRSCMRAHGVGCWSSTQCFART